VRIDRVKWFLCMQDMLKKQDDEGFYVMKDSLTVIINDNQHE